MLYMTCLGEGEPVRPVLKQLLEQIKARKFKYNKICIITGQLGRRRTRAAWCLRRQNTTRSNAVGERTVCGKVYPVGFHL